MPSSLLDALEGVINPREIVPGLATAGQPSPEHLARLKGAGCSVVIDLRDPMEPQPIDARAVQAAGLRYLNIPTTHAPADDQTFDRMRESLRESLGAGASVLVYCNSGNRVGSTVLPYLMLERGFAEDAAVTAALKIGTRQMELVEAALAYVRHRR